MAKVTGGAPMAKQTLLIVDDEPDALQLFGRILMSLGGAYRVLLARDGSEAADLLHECRPDLILLDLIMPNMDGFQLLDRLRQDPALCDIPVLIISARDPFGGPIVSNGYAVVRQGGMSATELLAQIQSLVTAQTAPTPIVDPDLRVVPPA